MSQSKVYVGNLPYTTTEDELRSFFSQYGGIEEVKLIVDFGTGRSKGFGFVTFANAEACEKAVQGANNQEMNGRKLKVNVARDNPRREGGGGGGGRGGRDGGNRGGNRGGYGGGGRGRGEDNYG